MARTAFSGDTIFKDALIEAAEGDEPWLAQFFNTSTFHELGEGRTLNAMCGGTLQHFFRIFPTGSADVIHLVETVFRDSGCPLKDEKADEENEISFRRTARKVFAQVAAEQGIVLDEAFVRALRDQQDPLLFQVAHRLETDFYADCPAGAQARAVVAETMRRADVRFAIYDPRVHP